MSAFSFLSPALSPLDRPNPLPAAAFARYPQSTSPVKDVPVKSLPGRNRENPRLACLLRDLGSCAAQNPVTRLWMPCTPLKIKEIKVHAFH